MVDRWGSGGPESRDQDCRNAGHGLRGDGTEQEALGTGHRMPRLRSAERSSARRCRLRCIAGQTGQVDCRRSEWSFVMKLGLMHSGRGSSAELGIECPVLDLARIPLIAGRVVSRPAASTWRSPRSIATSAGSVGGWRRIAQIPRATRSRHWYRRCLAAQGRRRLGSKGRGRGHRQYRAPARPS